MAFDCLLISNKLGFSCLQGDTSHQFILQKYKLPSKNTPSTGITIIKKISQFEEIERVHTPKMTR